ncbi:hypothetical protein K438DRAFT_1887374, partial [Mycena galopus ATCC 62051]
KSALDVLPLLRGVGGGDGAGRAGRQPAAYRQRVQVLSVRVRKVEKLLRRFGGRLRRFTMACAFSLRLLTASPLQEGGYGPGTSRNSGPTSKRGKPVKSYTTKAKEATDASSSRSTAKPKSEQNSDAAKEEEEEQKGDAVGSSDD